MSSLLSDIEFLLLCPWNGGMNHHVARCLRGDDCCMLEFPLWGDPTMCCLLISPLCELPSDLVLGAADRCCSSVVFRGGVLLPVFCWCSVDAEVVSRVLLDASSVFSSPGDMVLSFSSSSCCGDVRPSSSSSSSSSSLLTSSLFAMVDNWGDEDGGGTCGAAPRVGVSTSVASLSPVFSSSSEDGFGGGGGLRLGGGGVLLLLSDCCNRSMMACLVP